MSLEKHLSVSVIMPTYNGERFLLEALESISKQTYPISELVISDDSSSDGTLDLVRKFAKRVNFKVHIVEHVPNGVTANYLNALRYATGDVICVSDQDDVWFETKVETIVPALSREDVSLVCHDCGLVDVQLKALGGTLRGDIGKSVALSRSINSADGLENLKVFLRGGLPMLAHSLAFKKELKELLMNKPTEIDSWWFEEWLSCVALTQARVYFISEPLVRYRQHDSQTSGGFGKASHSTEPPADVATKYASRIEKMNYCASIATEDLPLERRSVFITYVDFMRRRDTILDKPLSIKPLLTCLGLLFRGHYHSYANGIMSFGLDILIQIKSKKLNYKSR